MPERGRRAGTGPSAPIRSGSDATHDRSPGRLRRRLGGHAPETNRRAAAADRMHADIVEVDEDLVAALAAHRLDDLVARDDRRLQLAAQRLDSAGEVDRVADDRELQALVAADVAGGGVAIVQPDANLDWLLPRRTAARIPVGDSVQQLQRALDRVGGVAQPGPGRAERRHHAVADVFVERAVAG